LTFTRPGFDIDQAKMLHLPGQDVAFTRLGLESQPGKNHNITDHIVLS